MIIRKNYNGKAHKVIPLMPQEKLGPLTNKIVQYAPEKYTDTMYSEHIQAALEKAEEFYGQKRACSATRLRYRKWCKTK